MHTVWLKIKTRVNIQLVRVALQVSAVCHKKIITVAMCFRSHQQAVLGFVVGVHSLKPSAFQDVCNYLVIQASISKVFFLLLFHLKS